VTVGIGMPIVLKFSPLPTDSTEFTKAAKVTVNDQPADGAWFWEQPTADDKKTHTIEAHYRMKNYWPANADIRVDLPIGGLSAGTGLVYDNKLTSVAFQTGDAHISMVTGGSKPEMVVRSNNKTVKTIPVSLGAAKTPTYTGTKIVMQKGEQDPKTGKLKPNGTVRMVGPGYDEPVQWSVRVTASGEYVHAAPWNTHLGQLSTSNGCTNLSVADAKWFYNFSLIGDVVQYANTTGTKMPSWDGYGDWNITWTQWQQGGLLLNH
jgi:lipoprotein-anchoring transpeptidase ErfK/SrfK